MGLTKTNDMEQGKKPFFETEFPSRECIITENTIRNLTQREYFAGLAMQAMITNVEICGILYGNNGLPVPELVAEYSLNYADALLAKLENQ